MTSDDTVTLATSRLMMHEADRQSTLQKNQNEWRRKQHYSNESRGHKTGHGVSYYQ